MKPLNRKMNFLYGLVQVSYWSGFCMAFIYAAVFLQDKGYSNTRLGFIMAAGNIIGLFLAPVLASLVDKAKRSGIFIYTGLLLAAELLLVLSFFGAKQGLYLSVAYSIHMGCFLSVTPLNTQLCFVLEGWCGKLNFGATRGAGSLAFALVSTFMGSIVFRFGTTTLLYGQLLVISLQAVLLIYIYLLDKSHSSGSLFIQEKETGSSLISFFRDNPRFSVMLLGVSMLFFAHNLLCNFFINVVSNLGGSTADMEKTINNMACSITGMICDGGNQGCTMKGVVAVDAAFVSVDMAMKNVYIFKDHGINGKTPEDTMRNMGLIASPGMVGTEKTIVDILNTKNNRM